MSLELQHNSKLIWIIAAIIVLIAGGLFAGQWYIKKQKAAQEAQQQAAAAQIAASQAQAQAAQQAAPASAPVATPEAATDAPITLVDDSIASAPIPSNPSLAKEEVAKLNDIQKQLQDQQKSLEGQHADADQLIKLKEEQVKLLEAQLGAK